MEIREVWAAIRDRTPAIFTEADMHGPTPNEVMAGFIGTPPAFMRLEMHRSTAG